MGCLPESEKKIARYILRHREDVIHQTVADIAKASGSSSSAVIRLCKSLNISGFSGLKIMLARDVFAETLTQDKPEQANPFISNTIFSSIESLKDVMNTLDPAEIHKAVELILHAKFINLLGIGQSNNIANDFAHKLQRLGFMSCSLYEFQHQAMLANNMDSSMLGIIVSHSGNTPEAIRFAELLISNKVPVITLTSNPEGKLIGYSDVVLMSSCSEPMVRSGASSSRIAQLTIVDIIFNTIVKTNPALYSIRLKSTAKAYAI